MSDLKTRLGRARQWALWGSVAMSALMMGCEGCGGMWDGVEARLQDDPTRTGKVGVWTGLEIAQEAREVAGSRARQREDRCQIGWTLDRPFEVSFSFEIRRRGEGERRWREEGKWRSDGAGRWTIESEVEFEDGARRSGEKGRRVVATEEGFFEYVDEVRAARRSPGSATQRWWRDEYGGRFQRMMRIAAPEKAGERGGAICDPDVGTSGVEDGWLELWREGVKSVHKDVVTYGDEYGRQCRELGLRAMIEGGNLEVALTECHQVYEGEIDWDEVELVDVDLDDSRVRLQEALEAWEDEGWIEEKNEIQKGEESDGETRGDQ